LKSIFAFFHFFFLKDKRLSASFRKGGFDALAADAGAASFGSQRLTNTYLLTLYEKCRTSF